MAVVVVAVVVVVVVVVAVTSPERDDGITNIVSCLVGFGLRQTGLTTTR